MFDKLRNTARRTFGGDDVDRILALPMTNLRLELKKAFSEKKFTQEQYDDFTARLLKLDLATKNQADLAGKAIKNREVNSEMDIELDTPAKQILWAAALTRIMDSHDAPIAQTKIWRQIKDTIAVHNESVTVSDVISKSFQNDDVTFDWGQPGSWFYFDPSANHINLDIYLTLMMGFEHMRVVHLHEIGHSEVSTTFPSRMKELYEKVKHIIDPSTIDDTSTTPEMTEKDQEKLMRDVAEWNCRFMLWHMVEDNCVNQFAVNMEKILPLQNFSSSFNNVGVYLQGFGEMARGDMDKLPGDVTSDMPKAKNMKEQIEQAWQKAMEEGEKKMRQLEMDLANNPLKDEDIKRIQQGKIDPLLAWRMFNVSKMIVWLSFYERTGLFTDNDKGWAKFKVFKDDINKTIDVSVIPEAKGKNAFDYLYDLSVGKKGIWAQQPQTSDRLFGEEHYRGVVEKTSTERNRMMEHIWDIYLKKYADILIEDAVQQMKNRMQQGQGNNQKQGQGQGQGQQSSQNGGSGMPQPGQQQQGNGSGGGEEKKELDRDLKEKIGDIAKTPKEKKEKENKKSEAQAASEAEKKNEEKSQGKGWDQDPSEDKSKKRVGDMRQRQKIDESMTPEQRQEMMERARQMNPDTDMSYGAGSGVSSSEIDLSALAKGDWRDFEKRVLELAPVINQVARSYAEVRERQRKEIIKISKTDHDWVANDGDFQGRLDVDKRLSRIRKEKSGSAIQVDDLKSFRGDFTQTAASTIEISIMIDGSGSMPTIKLANGVSAMEAALQSTVITYMAARKVGIDAYIIMWGDDIPVVLATPKTPLKEVGKRLEHLRNGRGTGTSLAPGIISNMEAMARHKNENGTISGSSHIVVFSDNGLADEEQTKSALSTIAMDPVVRARRNMSVDFVIFGDAQNELEGPVRQVIEQTGTTQIGIIREDDPNEAPRLVAREILSRVRSFKVTTEPDHKKRQNLKKMHQKMTNG